jgi:hypothetical protein
VSILLLRLGDTTNLSRYQGASLDVGAVKKLRSSAMLTFATSSKYGKKFFATTVGGTAQHPLQISMHVRRAVDQA